MGKAAASARVIDEWARRVEAEYRSTAIATNLALWLVQIGASPDLVKAALRISREELGHSALSHRVHVAACRAGGQAEPAATGLDRGSLRLIRHPAEPLEHDVTRACVEVFCLGETVAVRLFKELRHACAVPVARRALDRVLRDEVGHRDFGWTLLAWLLEHPLGSRLKQIVVTELPSFLQHLATQYAPPDGASETTISAADASWGLMPAARYGLLLQTCLDKDCVPRFARLGIDARSAPPGGVA